MSAECVDDLRYWIIIFELSGNFCLQLSHGISSPRCYVILGGTATFVVVIMVVVITIIIAAAVIVPAAAFHVAHSSLS
jgi:hypothetical protein